MALDDVRHVEACALMRNMLDDSPLLSDDVHDTVVAWLEENHPPPGAYVAAARAWGMHPPKEGHRGAA
jgi:hypothetical protein